MPIATSAMVLLFAIIIVFHLILTLYHINFYAFYSNILAEAHGMLFGIFFMHIMICWLNQHAERKQNINKFPNDTDDWWYWYSEEAAYINAGNIKNLNRKRIYKLNLPHCYLKENYVKQS